MLSQPAPIALNDPLVVAHIRGYKSSYHLYLTGLDPETLIASGYELSGLLRPQDGARLFYLYWLDDVPVTRWTRSSQMSIDLAFLPCRLSELRAPA